MLPSVPPPPAAPSSAAVTQVRDTEQLSEPLVLSVPVPSYGLAAEVELPDLSRYLPIAINGTTEVDTGLRVTARLDAFNLHHAPRRRLLESNDEASEQWVRSQVRSAFASAPELLTPSLWNGPPSLQLVSGVFALSVERVPSGEQVPVAFEVTLSSRLPPSGGGICASDGDCFGGVCCNGVCSCLQATAGANFFGEHCEFSVDCSRWEADQHGWSPEACSAYINATVQASNVEHGDDFRLVTCSCDELSVGDVAATLRWSERWLPRSNVAFDRTHVVQLLASGRGLIAHLLLILAIAIPCARAWYLDASNLHQGKRPKWLLQPTHTWSFSFRLRYHLRLHHPLLRIAHVCPGHVRYTRLQLVTALLNQLIISACSVLTFHGARQCNAFREPPHPLRNN